MAIGRKVGHKVSLSTKKKIKLSLMGRLYWKNHKKTCICPICQPNNYNQSRMKNKKHTLKAKQKIAKASLARWQDKDYIKKVSKAISKGKTGVKFSEEHKENLSKNNAKYWKGTKGMVKSNSTSFKKGHKNYPMKTNKVRHHIYLKQNSDEIITLTVSKHNSLHKRAYDYIYDKYGEKGINSYLKWFNKRFNLEEQ